MRALTVPTTDGFPLAVQVDGRDDARVLLLLAGQANSHRWWTGLREAYGERFQVVTLDQRGTGGSRGPVGAWSTASFADDAAHVLDALGVRSAAVFGTSMGGRVAQHLAARRPDLVHRLVLACTSPGGPLAVERGAQVRRSLADPDEQRRVRALHALFYTPAWPHGPDESHLLGDPTMTAAEQRAHLRASARHDAWDQLPAITAPTLVLHGAADLMTPVENVDLLAERIPDCTTAVHPQGRHGFFEEFADEVTPRVLAFL